MKRLWSMELGWGLGNNGSALLLCLPRFLEVSGNRCVLADQVPSTNKCGPRKERPCDPAIPKRFRQLHVGCLHVQQTERGSVFDEKTLFGLFQREATQFGLPRKDRIYPDAKIIKTSWTCKGLKTKPWLILIGGVQFVKRGVQSTFEGAPPY